MAIASITSDRLLKAGGRLGLRSVREASMVLFARLIATLQSIREMPGRESAKKHLVSPQATANLLALSTLASDFFQMQAPHLKFYYRVNSDDLYVPGNGNSAHGHTASGLHRRQRLVLQ